jgi:hypothetical protein
VEAVPSEVEIGDEAPPPVTDPTLGIAVDPPTRDGIPVNRLVVIGDSLSHGFQSGAIFHTDLSYPALIARELGWSDAFRFPTYPGFGGIPLNIEFLLAELEDRFGSEISPWETPLALYRVHQHLAESEAWWDKGPGSTQPPERQIMHNLAIYGWDLRDALERTADVAAAEWRVPPDWQLVPLIRNADKIAALRVLGSARDSAGKALTPFGAAAALGAEGEAGPAGADPGEGIETLIVFLGANNALGSVLKLAVRWSGDGYDDLKRKADFTVWRPSHFEAELKLAAEEVRKIRARHVIWGTIPHVTIAPIARGVGGKVKPGSRYFRYYTRPWISDSDFDPAEDHPYITADEARAVDSAIDQYNATIREVVAAGRREGRDWRLLDVCGLLDRLAARRYIEDPEVKKPAWWDDFPSPLPPQLEALDPVPDTRFFSAGDGGRTAGGLISLDGIHPTTIAYGVLASKFIEVMVDAGVVFRDGAGAPRAQPALDFERLAREDALISSPPASLGSDLATIGWVDERIDVIRRLWSGL